MENEIKLAAGAMVSLAIATAALVVLPYIQVRDIAPPDGASGHNSSAGLRGRAVYIASSCVYCHASSRATSTWGDLERGWGRASVPGDYFYDKPHELGSMRTGPSLFSNGARQPTGMWGICTSRAPIRRAPSPAYPTF